MKENKGAFYNKDFALRFITDKNLKFKHLMKRPHYVTDKALKQFIKSALEEDIQSGDHSTSFYHSQRIGTKC